METPALPDKLWFMFHQGQLLLRKTSQGREIPRGQEQPLPTQYLVQRVGMHEGLECLAFALDIPQGGLPDELKGAYEPARLWFNLYDEIGNHLYRLASKGMQQVWWDTHSQCCCVCGGKTALATTESKKCPSCGNEMFPPISVAILALVIKKDAAGESILLARSKHFVVSNHVLISGFAEPGENLEQCVRREVLEETGLVVENIRYLGSQAWPSPSNLMVGFAADYKSGEIKLQEDELSSAAFFRADALPQIPHPYTLARDMIDWWLKGAEPLPGTGGLPL